MIKWKISYTDYFGNKNEDEVYFNLSKPELVTYGFKLGGKRADEADFQKLINEIVVTEDREQIVKMVSEVILSSYGEKTEDGKGFRKTKKLRKKFEQSAAFEALFMELMTDTDKLNAFIIGLLPADLQEEAKANGQNLITSKQ